MAEMRMPDDLWIIDSIPYIYFSLEKKHSYFPLIPLLLTLEFQRKMAKCSIDFSIWNDKKLILTVDSVYYQISDSLGVNRQYDTLIFGKDFFNRAYIYHPLSFSSLYSINLKIHKKESVFVELKIYYTNTNHQSKIISSKKTRMSYYYRNRLWCIVDV